MKTEEQILHDHHVKIGKSGWLKKQSKHGENINNIQSSAGKKGGRPTHKLIHKLPIVPSK